MNFDPEHSKKRLEILQKVNPVLNPEELKALFPGYKDFIAHQNGFGLWSTLESTTRFLEGYLRQDRVLLAISGVAAGGKDAIRETIERLQPGLSFKAITATSRAIREGEAHGQDYYFYPDAESFQEAVKKGEFLEHVAQGDRYYGMPKQSLRDALRQEAPVVTTHVEMFSGWPAIDDFAETELADYGQVFPLKVFVLPNMPFKEYAETWLPERRDDVKTRLLRTAEEIAIGASRADIILTNTIGKNLDPLEAQANALANHCIILLNDQESKGFSPTDTPFLLSAGPGTSKQIIEYHQRVLMG